MHTSISNSKVVAKPMETTTEVERYSVFRQAIHWIVALFVISQVAMALVLSQLRSLEYGQILLAVHRQIGFAIILFTILRCITAIYYRAPRYSTGFPTWQKLAATAVHVAFNAALVIQPLLGIGVAWGRGDPVSIFGLITLPAPWEISDDAREQFMQAHRIAAQTIVALIVVHVGAVVFNHLKRKVSVLNRMLPSGPPNTLINRVSVRIQLLAAFGIVIAVALGTGINAVVTYRNFTEMTDNYQQSDQTAAAETRLAQVAWKEIVGTENADNASNVIRNSEKLRTIADEACTHLDSGASVANPAAARDAITTVKALMTPLANGGQPFTKETINSIDTHLQELIDEQSASAQQRVADMTESASQGHDLIVVTVAPMVILALVLALLLARSMTSSIGQMRSLVRSVESNEGFQSIEVLGQGEFSALMRDMVAMQTAVQARMQKEAAERLALEVSHREVLEIRVAERTEQLSKKTKDINAMLQNMNIGVSTITAGNLIHPEYSKYLCTIFAGDDFAYKNVMTAIFGKASLGIDAMEQVSASLDAILGADPIMFEFNEHLLPREIKIVDGNGVQKILQMDWSPIVNDEGLVDKVLHITQDITHLRKLEEDSAQQQEELGIISKLIKTPTDKFIDFTESAIKYLADNRLILNATKSRDEEAISALFRNMHTIKGNARVFEFTHITNAAHIAEQNYDRMRKDKEVAWNSDELSAELDAVETALKRYIKVSEETLGRRKGSSGGLIVGNVSVSDEQLAELRSLVVPVAKMHAANADVVRLHNAIATLGLTPLSSVLGEADVFVSSLAKELGKPTPVLEVENGGIAFNTQFARTLKDSLIHIVRNSLDHGIEPLADRVRANKSEHGKIRFSCEQNGERMELHIKDDGRGLALHKLYEKGCASGVFDAGKSPTRANVAELIFQSGVSTSEQLTEISGRGVGMDAVRALLAEHGATIAIDLPEPSGTTLQFTPFKFVINLPVQAYRNTNLSQSNDLLNDALSEINAQRLVS